MDDARFDALAKRLANGVSRRDLLRGLAGLTGAGLAALMGRSSATATACSSRCDRLPAGTSRDQCLAACAAADEARANAEAEAEAARATAEAERAATRAWADALRACGGDESRLCGSGSSVACCTSDETCQNGACVPDITCVPSGGTCAGTGDCCAPNVCSGGICTIDEVPCGDCAAGESCCGGACVNLQTDPAHCGGCDIPCATGEVCDEGSCCTPATCPAGQCGSFPDGCGGTLACDCGAGQVCREGSCCTLLTCQPGQCGSPPDGCGGILHCGGCAGGETCCAGTCADLQTDAAHCGTCGHACSSGQTCCNGACAETCFFGDDGCCPAGHACCGGIDCCEAEQACCGTACCEAGASCCDSACCSGDCCGGVECCEPGACCEAAGTCCASGQICCGDQCTDLNDSDNCGICDNTCAPNQVCLGRDGCCTPITCDGRCGTISDGCGGTLECGDDNCDTTECLTCDVPSGTCVTTCTDGQVCHEESCCTLATCQAKQCGSFSDGCGGTIDCGTCGAGEQCINNGCFISGNSDMCSESTENHCPCNSRDDCCECSRDFASTPDYICWRAIPEPATIDCNSDADCPRGWVCFTNSDDPSCVPPC